MNVVNVAPGSEGYGSGLVLPIGSGLKVVSLTGREIHPVARRLGELTQSEVINGFQAVPPDEETLCVVINCGGSLRCGLYPKKGIKTINVMPTGQTGPLAQFINAGNYVSDVREAQITRIPRETLASEPQTATVEPSPPATRPQSVPTPGNMLILAVEKLGNKTGYVIALLFAASREAVDVSLRTVIPFMAFVSVLIAIVQATSLGNVIAHALTPMANSLWGLLLLSAICGIPFLSPILGPGAAITQVVGVMIGTQIGLGNISPAFALPALFAINVQVGCDFVPVGLSMQEAKPETIASGVPAFLLSRQLTGPLAVMIGWVFSLGLF
ncbi:MULTISPECIES: PTS glucitol/sorbitol transporter subunit IIB [unclassified Raoultella]|uniref:PTS glucitol/sorbitol transporter subunit IIB n=1 Tax=unclassified Raoultella TaxID=2627600 RepID=UPI0013592318|nr:MULTISPECIES: PTS glucitol/sorbitol transporter subunit IIB [unclassified Raoultella]